METKKITSMGMVLNPLVPSTVEEFDANAKKVGACLDYAVSDVLAHVWLTDFRDLFLHGQKEIAAVDGKPAVPAIQGVEELTGIDRNTKPVLDKEGKPVVKDGEAVTEYDESEAKYFNRVATTLVKQGKFPDEDAAKASFQELADHIVSILPVDASAIARAPSGPKKLAAKYKNQAAVILTNGNVARYNSGYLSKIGKSFTPTNDTTKMFSGTVGVQAKDGTVKQVAYNVSDKDAEALGWLVKEWSDWKAAEDAKAMQADLSE